jgi:ribosomal protein L29
MANAFTSLETAALVGQLGQLETDLTKGQFQLASRKLENTASLRKIRADIARIKTELRRREIAEGLSKATYEAAAKPVALSGGANEAANLFAKLG